MESLNSAPRTGRPKSLSPRDRRSITRLMHEDPKLSNKTTENQKPNNGLGSYSVGREKPAGDHDKRSACEEKRVWF